MNTIENVLENVLEQAKQLIYSVDLEPVINRLVAIEGWSKPNAIAAVKQYRNYLFLRKKYPGVNLPPSKDMDEAWHAHILHTRDYRAFCKQAFSDHDDFYLDHDPHLANEGSMERLAQLFEQTQKLYYQEFGEYIYQIRSQSLLRKIIDKIS